MRWSREEIQRSGAYHEAAHAVVDVLEDHTVRYVSIETKGTDYRDICVSAVTYHDMPGRYCPLISLSFVKKRTIH